MHSSSPKGSSLEANLRQSRVHCVALYQPDLLSEFLNLRNEFKTCVLYPF